MKGVEQTAHPQDAAWHRDERFCKSPLKNGGQAWDVQAEPGCANLKDSSDSQNQAFLLNNHPPSAVRA